MNKQLKFYIYVAVILIASIISIGVLGYMFFADYSLVDALYMTIITVTTVGFGEVNPLNTNGKIFTIILILTSITVYGYVVSTLTEVLIGGHFFERIKQNKMQKKIKKLKNHTIVCGYGRNGKQAITKLKSYHQPFVIIEKNKDIIDKLEDLDYLCVEGDSTVDEVLEKAGIKRASSLITALPSDADNLFVVLSAKQMNKKCKVISRASKESSYKKLIIAGAENVIMPDKLGGAHMASLVVTPDVIEFVDKLTFEGEETTNLKEISVNDLPERFLNQTILDIDVRRKTGCNVIGFKTADKEYIVNPDATTKLVKDSHLILLGRPEQIAKLKTCFS